MSEGIVLTDLHTLASGSSGNALLLSQRRTPSILLDAGISCRRITSALRSLGVELPDAGGHV